MKLSQVSKKNSFVVQRTLNFTANEDAGFVRRAMITTGLVLFCSLVMLVLPQSAKAALVNGDFSAGLDATVPSGWSVITGTNGENAQKREADNGGLSPQDGVSGTNGYALFTGNSGAGVYDGALLTQAISVIPNALHTLSFYLGRSSSLTTDFNVLVTQSTSGDLLDEDLTVTAIDDWDFFTFDFTPTASSITLSFEDISNDSSSNAGGVDTVSLTFVPLLAPVPEPATGAILWLGGGALLAFSQARRRRIATRI